MPDIERISQDALAALARPARHLPGLVGGMGVYFDAKRRLSEDPGEGTWRDDVETLLARADRTLRRGRVDAALRWFDKALRISYHPSLHQGGSSPLAADPEVFLRPLRRSATGRVMLESPVPSGSAPARPADRSDEQQGRPLRLLVVAQENWTFIRPIIEALESAGHCEVRQIDVDDLAAPGFPDRDRIIRGRYDLITSGQRMPTPPELADGYAWADVTLVEWCHHVLTWITLLDRAPRTLMARLHRFEVFTPFALMHDHARIDRLLYVSPPVWNMAAAIAPGFAGIPSRQVGNLLSRGLEVRPRQDRDRTLLVQVGWVREVKDVLFSLDVLERLRRHDDAYRLRLIGAGLPAAASRDTPYQRRVRTRLQQLGPAVVEQIGVREDVPALLAESGVILSSSRHEGTHESVMEALATGCPAVIRDWPDTVDYGGPGTLYEPDWVVADVDAAVERILSLRDPQRYRADSHASREFALAHRDPATVVADYERALRPDTTTA